jgi:hypothetical protein
MNFLHRIYPVFDIVSDEKSEEDIFVMTLGLDNVIFCYSYLNISFYLSDLFYFFLSFPPWNSIFYRPRVGDSTSSDSIVATTIDQNISEMVI